MEEEKRTSLRVGSSDFISLDPLKTFFSSSNVSEVLMEFQCKLSTPSLDFSGHRSESAEPCSESAELYAKSTELYAKSAQPYAESAQSCKLP